MLVEYYSLPKLARFFDTQWILSTVCQKKTRQLWQAVVFDKHGLILIIFGKQHQHTFKNDTCSTFLGPPLLFPYYGRPLSLSGRPWYILPMFYSIFYGRLILRPWLTEVRESFTRGGP